MHVLVTHLFSMPIGPEQEIRESCNRDECVKRKRKMRNA